MSDQGCQNAHCWVRLGTPPKQHTNGRCNCLRDMPTKVRIQVERKVTALTTRIVKLEKALMDVEEFRRKQLYETCPDCWGNCDHGAKRCKILQIVSAALNQHEQFQ